MNTFMFITFPDSGKNNRRSFMFLDGVFETTIPNTDTV